MVGPGILSTDEFGESPYGYAPGPLTVTTAEALNPTLVQLNFSDLLDFTNPATLLPGSYDIQPVSVGSAPTILSVTGAGSAVFLRVTTLSFVLYLATATGALTAVDGATLDPDADSATFTGIAPEGLFDSQATAARRVRLLFGVSLLNDAALSDPTNYTVTDLVGNDFPVASVVVEPSVTGVTLVLSTSMSTTEWYVATVSPDVKTAGGLSIQPNTSKFQYVRPSLSVTFPLEGFSGEAQGGLLGNPLGLVFFSPSLSVSTANSIMQVDDVSVCTKAYDEYVLPAAIDPTPLYTYGPGGPGGTLNTGLVLWAPFPRLVEARTTLSAKYQDTAPLATDGMATVVLREPWDQNYVALLNNPGWKIFDNTGTATPPMFICAMNTAPIPPGPNTIRVLTMPLGADADLHADIDATFGAIADLTSTASLGATLT